MDAYAEETIARMISKTVKDEVTGCWLWVGAVGGKNDYPSMHYKQRTHRATRVMFELTYGVVPDGLYVCHKCDTPKCINPEHLFLGTQKHNMIDASKKGRCVVPKQAKGSAHRNSVFTDDQVMDVRQKFYDGATTASLAQEFGTAECTIKRVVSGKSYQNLPVLKREDSLMNNVFRTNNPRKRK
jgi:hypothetical protein